MKFLLYIVSELENASKAWKRLQIKKEQKKRDCLHVLLLLRWSNTTMGTIETWKDNDERLKMR